MRKVYRNIKNGKLYTVIGYAANCTNGREHEMLVLYKLNDDDLVFARNREEFWQKFEEINRCE